MPHQPLSLAVPAARVWTLAAIAGAAATALLYDSQIGVNLTICTAIAAGGLVAISAARDATHRSILVPLAFALLLAIGAAVTADAPTQALVMLIAASVLALATVLTALAPTGERYDAVFILRAPVVALLASVWSGMHTVADSVGSIDTLRRHPALRGALLGIPVVLIFAALFAEADPIFARGRDAVSALITPVDALPRIGFFAVVTFVALGAYAYAASEEARGAPAARTTTGAESVDAPHGPERTIVLACAAAVSWIFVVLQIAYVAVDVPARTGSGVTYAEYAHRGFGQLSVVATIAVLLVVEALGRQRTASAAPRLRVAGLALLTAVGGVLVSAFHRVTLYENVYGFTTARVEAQAYMLVVLAVLALCAVETARGFDAARLARATTVVALAALATLTFWNDQAWIVRQDVARFAGTKRLDVGYLAQRLSPDAYPALLDALPALPVDQRQALASALWPTATCELRNADRWFEWNAGRARARAALRGHGFPLTPPANAPCIAHRE